jgi:hypothetical protein
VRVALIAFVALAVACSTKDGREGGDAGPAQDTGTSATSCTPPGSAPAGLLLPDPRMPWSGAVAIFAGMIADWSIDSVLRPSPRPDRPFTVLDTTALTDGEHRLSLHALAEDGSIVAMETPFCVSNGLKTSPKSAGGFVDVTSKSALGSLSGYSDPGAHGNFLGAIAADFDGDGDLDLFVWDRNGGRVWDQSAPFEFLPRGDVITGVHAAGAADLDGDGDPDLVAVGDSVKLLRNDGGSLTDVTRDVELPNEPPYYFRAVTFADVDMDGLLDVVVTQLGCSEARPTPPMVLRNESDFHFADVTKALGFGGREAEGFGVAIDVPEEDGAMHAWLFHEGCVTGSTAHLRLQPGADLPTPVVEKGLPIRVAPMGSAWLDANADGKLDLALAGDFTSPVLRGTALDESISARVGLDSFIDRDSAPVSAWSPVVLDVDLDGHADLFVVHHGSDPAIFAQESSRDGLFWQATPGAFREIGGEIGLGGVARCRSAQGADLDGDGDTDLIVGCLDRIRILRNDVAAANVGRTIVLHGATSNTDGVHAILATAGNERRLVRGGGQPYAGGVVRESIRAGGGDLRVWWPTGIAQTIAAGTTPVLHVREPVTVGVTPRRIAAGETTAISVSVDTRAFGSLPVKVEASTGSWVAPMMVGADGVSRGTLAPPSTAATVVLTITVGTTRLRVRPRVFVR